MTNEELEIWKSYDKYKSPHKKSNLIRDLKYIGELDSLERLSEEVLKNRSSTIRHEAIQAIEYLELKLTPNRNKLDLLRWETVRPEIDLFGLLFGYF